MMLIPLMVFGFSAAGVAADGFEKDSFTTAAGTVTIIFIGHGTLMIDIDGYIIHIDPVSREADYAALPKADLILITHHHSDHLDTNAIKKIRNPSTVVVANPTAAEQVEQAKVMRNGDSLTIDGIAIDAIPAYNTTEGRSRFHPKGRDNGYVLSFGGKKVYIAGDTEVIPEMSSLTGIDIAFLPVNQPYTMTPEQAAEAARIIKPAVLYPYHYGDTDVNKMQSLLASEKGIDVRIRSME
jgi:L-ascorbate metabolism protein UlaG (beta-lactamase superfamily)